ncbi:MAG: tetratricopeptide repeat protein [Methanobacteriaceae archaeon]|nr:tetratricopeptide repeat protein [Methanobacteriaceae archaeon]
MLKNLFIIGIFDSFKDKSSALKNYEKRLHKYQEDEADTLIDIGVIYLEEEQIDEALKSFKEALDLYKKLKFVEGEAYTENLIGDTYIANQNLTEALKHYEKSLKLYSDMESPLYNDLQEKIDMVLSLQEENKSQEILEEVSISPKNQDFEREEDMEESSGEISGIEELESAEIDNILPNSSNISKYDLDSKKLGSKLERVIQMLENVDMYETYSHEKDPINYLKDAYVNSELIDDKTGKATIGLLIGDVLLKKGEADKALQTFKESFEIFNENNDEKGEALSLLLIGSVSYLLNDKKTMYNVFKKSLEIFNKLNDKKGESVAIDLINTLYKG